MMDSSTRRWISVSAASPPSASLSSSDGSMAGPSSMDAVLDETSGSGNGISLDERVPPEEEHHLATITMTSTHQSNSKQHVPTINIVSEQSELSEHHMGRKVIIPNTLSQDVHKHKESAPFVSIVPTEIFHTSSPIIAPRSTSTPEKPSTSSSTSSSSTPHPPPPLGSHPIRRSSPLKQEIHREEDGFSEPSFVIEQDVSSVDWDPVEPITLTTSNAAVTPVRVTTSSLRDMVVLKELGGSFDSPYGESSADTSSFPFSPLFPNLHTHNPLTTNGSPLNDDLSLLMNERGSFLLPSDESLVPTPIRKHSKADLSEIVEDEEEEGEGDDETHGSVEMGDLLRGLREGSPLISVGLGGSTRTLRGMEVGEEHRGDRGTPNRVGGNWVLASTALGSSSSTTVETSPTPSIQADTSMMDRSKIDVEELFSHLTAPGHAIGLKGKEGVDDGLGKGVEDESMRSLFEKKDDSLERSESEGWEVEKEGEEHRVDCAGIEATFVPPTQIQEPCTDHSTTTLEDVQGASSQLLGPLVSSTVKQEKRVEDESMLSFEMMREGETSGNIEGILVESPLAVGGAMEREQGSGGFVVAPSPPGTPDGSRTVRPSSPVRTIPTTTAGAGATMPLSATATAVPTPSRGLERLRNKMVALRLGALQTQTQSQVENPAPSTEPTTKLESEVGATTTTPIRRPRLSSTILQTPIGSSAAALRLEKYRALTTTLRTVTVGSNEGAIFEGSTGLSRDAVVTIKPSVEDEEEGRKEVATKAPRTPLTTTTTPLRTSSTLDTSAKRHKRSESIQLTSSAGKSLFSPAVTTMMGPRSTTVQGIGASPSVRLGTGGERRRSLIATVASPVKMRSLREGEGEEPRTAVRRLMNPTRSTTTTASRVGVGAGRSGPTTTRPAPSARSTTTSTTPSRVSLLTGGQPTPRTTTTTMNVVPNRDDQNVAPTRNAIRPSTTSSTTMATSNSLLPLRSSALLKTRPTFQPRVLKPLVSSRTSTTTTLTNVGAGSAAEDRPRFGLGPLPARSTAGTTNNGVGGVGVGARKVGRDLTMAAAGTRRSLAPVAAARSAAAAVGSRTVLG